MREWQPEHVLGSGHLRIVYGPKYEPIVVDQFNVNTATVSVDFSYSLSTSVMHCLPPLFISCILNALKKVVLLALFVG